MGKVDNQMTFRQKKTVLDAQLAEYIVHVGEISQTHTKPEKAYETKS